MGLTSLQVCMDSADHWLQVQGTMEDESGIIMDSSSLSPSSGGDMLAAACSRPAAAALMERRLRPPHDQALKCPRCESTHTKFCYYNNYSLTQPRYFCKTCRRYWTKGGTLRNIPVGGGCRKSKKPSKNNLNKSSNSSSATSSPSSSSHLHHHDLIVNNNHHHHFNSLLPGNMAAAAGGGFMMNSMMEPIDFLESKLEGIVGSSRMINTNYDFMGNGGAINNGSSTPHHHDHDQSCLGLGGLNGNFHGMGCCSPFGMSGAGVNIDGGESANNNYATVAAAGMSFMETCQRLMLPYDHHDDHHQNDVVDGHGHDHDQDVKPTTAKLLSLEHSWQDNYHHLHQHEAAAKETTTSTGFGYLNGLGSWNNDNGTTTSATATTTSTGVNHHHNQLHHHHLMMNGYGSSTNAATNPLV